MTEQLVPPPSLGPLAAALAKAQMEFGTVTRDKTVRVTSERTGKSYTFAYAPLDSILAAVRKPLSANGLVLVQLLDDGALVTRLLHDSGASLTGRIDLPQTGDIQALGSAITYLRRYAIQAMLGIAAEDDDDGNRAEGNDATEAPRRQSPQRGEAVNGNNPDGSLIGTIAIANGWLEDLQVRQTPDFPVIGFRLKQGRTQQKVQARGPLAIALGGLGTELIGTTVTCWGQLKPEEFTPKGQTHPVHYQVLHLERIHGATFDIPARYTAADDDEPPEPVLGAHEAESEPLFDEAGEKELNRALGLV